MKIAILITLIMVLIVGGTVVALLFFLKKTDTSVKDDTENPNLKTAQEFLPFEDIRDDMIILDKRHYRAVLACSSLNYHLKTAGEKEQIELSFQRFLNSISFPVTFFLQTKVIDNTERLARLKKEISSTLNSFPGMHDYAEQYFAEMQHLNERLGNSQQKKRYIIITYDDVEDLSALNEFEKADYAAKELHNRCLMIQGNLDAVGVTSHIMSTEELIELVYSTYHRDNYSFSSSVASGDCFSLFVDGEEDRFANMPHAQLLDVILGETVSKIQVSNADGDAAGQEILKQIELLRQKNAERLTGKGGRQ